MRMETTGEIAVDVDRPAAFSFVQNPERLAGCIPGCRDVREVSPRHYTAVLSSRVAFMTLSFNVTIDVVRMEPPTAIEAQITGDAIGVPGHLVATASLELAEAGERRTSIRYATDIALAGKLGGIGQPVFRATSVQMARQFGANLKAAIESGAGARELA